MNLEYCMRTDRIVDEAGREHTVYGIDVVYGEQILRSAADVFCDAAAAERFIRLCNELALSPEHFDDAIADAVIA